MEKEDITNETRKMNKILKEARNNNFTPPDKEQINKFIKLLKIYTNPIDNKIIEFIIKEDKTISELFTYVGISRIHIWKHLKKLEKLKLIERTKKGREVFISPSGFCLTLPYILYAVITYSSLSESDKEFIRLLKSKKIK